jgi:hypothetical protein
MDTIGEEEKSYGYIIGLQVERCPTDRVGEKLYATFEYNGKVAMWRVPDPALFRILSGYLCSMAEFRVGGEDYGYSKLWIKKQDGKWIVDLP